MPRETTGGTKMYCSNCEELTICKGVSPKDVDYNLASERRYYKTAHEDVQWFRRGRICLDCGYKFISAEIRESFIDELVELREALGEIKKNAEKYIRESESASKTLKKLSNSLNVLRALKMYQEQDELDKFLEDAEEDDDEFEEDNWEEDDE